MPPIRKTEKVNLLQTQCIDESLCILCHARKCRRHFTGRAGNTGIVEDDHFAVFRQTVEDGWIPMIQVAREVLVEDERNSTPLAPTTIGETNSVGLDK
jgi:hypothetical protein